jgi:hypothetical protein
LDIRVDSFKSTKETKCVAGNGKPIEICNWRVREKQWELRRVKLLVVNREEVVDNELQTRSGKWSEKEDICQVRYVCGEVSQIRSEDMRMTGREDDSEARWLRGERRKETKNDIETLREVVGEIYFI